MGDCNCNQGVSPNTCGNPCSVTMTNTAACESLPSQISNFTLQFFGEVIKTEIDGAVTWSLPCGLDTGLPNNPRAAGEGLACYFLRLFMDGIIGLTGPKGDDGTPGTNGKNAFTISLSAFAQPTLGAPNIALQVFYNPVILPGSFVFVQDSGWYLVDSADTSGGLILTLSRPLSSIVAGSTVDAGKLVTPSGYPGSSIVGPAGPQGIQGIQGPPGNTFTSTNVFEYNNSVSNYSIQIAYAQVVFGSGTLQVTLPDAGTYLVTAVVDIVAVTGISLTDEVFAKLYNVSDASEVPGSVHSVLYLTDTQKTQIVINVIMSTAGATKAIGVYAQATTADKAQVAITSTLSAVRLS